MSFHSFVRHWNPPKGHPGPVKSMQKDATKFGFFFIKCGVKLACNAHLPHLHNLHCVAIGVV